MDLAAPTKAPRLLVSLRQAWEAVLAAGKRDTATGQDYPAGEGLPKDDAQARQWLEKCHHWCAGATGRGIWPHAAVACGSAKGSALSPCAAAAQRGTHPAPASFSPALLPVPYGCRLACVAAAMLHHN